MSRIKVIEYKESKGRLREIYDNLISKRGKLANVHTIQSLKPESIVKHMDLYMEIMFSKSELTRACREMLGVVVSVFNNCEYCQIHHAEALNNYWKNTQKVEQLRKNYKTVDLSKTDMQLCEYARILTTDTVFSKENDITEKLYETGLSDTAILDATLVVSYFNFVNRIVLALGVEVENDLGTGYKY